MVGPSLGKVIPQVSSAHLVFPFGGFFLVVLVTAFSLIYDNVFAVVTFQLTIFFAVVASVGNIFAVVTFQLAMFLMLSHTADMISF